MRVRGHYPYNNTTEIFVAMFIPRNLDTTILTYLHVKNWLVPPILKEIIDYSLQLNFFVFKKIKFLHVNFVNDSK